MTRESLNEDDAIAGVVDRLSERFPDRPRPEISDTVDDVRHGFDDAKLRDFVPVLVEKGARDRLTHHDE
jgi:hypothetical protein